MNAMVTLTVIIILVGIIVLDRKKGLWDNPSIFFRRSKRMNALVALTVIIILVNIIVLDSSDCLCNASLGR